MREMSKVGEGEVLILVKLWKLGHAVKRRELKVGERISHGHRHMLRSSEVRRERKKKKEETKMVCLQRREYQCKKHSWNYCRKGKRG